MVVQGPPSGSIPWFLTEGSTSPLATSSSPLRGNHNVKHHHHQASRSISGAVAGEASSSSTRFQSTNLISPHLHYLPFASGFPLPHFTIYLSFSSLPLHQFAGFIRLSFSFAVFLVRSVLLALLNFCVVIMAQENTKLCDFSNTNNDDFISTPIAPPATSAESCEINAALLNLVMKEQFSGTPNEDVASHLNTFVELCDM